MNPAVGLWALVALPLLAAATTLATKREDRRRQALIGVGGSALLVIGSGWLLSAAWSDPVTATALPPVPIGGSTIQLLLRADRAAALIAVMVSLVYACVQVYSVAYQAGDRRYCAYVATVALFAAAMLAVVVADDLLITLLGWEVMGLCSYLLIGHDSQLAQARAAAVKAFLVTRVADLAFMVAIVILSVLAGTTSISGLLGQAAAGGLSGTWLTVALLGLVVGVLGKSGQLPLSTWLPDAMTGPTPVSALIHAATMVAAGSVVLVRLLPILAAAPVARAVLAITSATTMLLGAAMAMVQADLKRVLAWSTVSQIAYVLAAIAVMPVDLLDTGAPALLPLLSHAGFKALLFLATGALARSAPSTGLGDLAGSGRRSPVAAAALTLGLASLAGLAPLAGFWGKEAVLGAAEEALASGSGVAAWTAWLVLGSALTTGVLTAVYAARVWLLVVPGPADGGRHANSVAITGPLLVLAGPTAAGGLLLWVIPGTIHLDPALAVAAGGVALATVGVIVWLGGDCARFLPNWGQYPLRHNLGLDAVGRIVVMGSTRRVAQAVAAVDAVVIDGGARAIGIVARWLARIVRRGQTGSITGYLRWLVVGTILAMMLGARIR